MNLLVSPTGYLARNVLINNQDRFKTVSFKDLKYVSLNDVENILVMGSDPQIYNNLIDPETSSEVQIARILSNRSDNISPSVRLIMISSRMVYGDDKTCNIRLKAKPTTNYGINKLNIEEEVIKILGLDKTLILRCSNIFGMEIGRSTFMGRVITNLLNNEIVCLDIHKRVKKDFLPIEIFTKYLLILINSSITGRHNLGAGCSVSVGDIIFNIFEGFKGGELQLIGKESLGEFKMSIDSLEIKNIGIVSLQEYEILEFATSLGARLRSYKNSNIINNERV